MGVTKKLWGNLNLDKLKELIEDSEQGVIHEYKGTNEIQILGTEFDGENVAIEIKWNDKYYTIARLKPSTKKKKEIDIPW